MAKVTGDHQMLALACAKRLAGDGAAYKENVEAVAMMFATYEQAIRSDALNEEYMNTPPKAVEQFLLSLE